jgi:hypothetical protein
MKCPAFLLLRVGGLILPESEFRQVTILLIILAAAAFLDPANT